MTARERAARHDAIIGDRYRGFPVSAIAQRHGMSERQVKRVIAQGLETRAENTLHEDPLHAVLEFLMTMERRIHDLAVLAETTNNEGVRLGAIKSAAELDERRFTALQHAGLAPLDLEEPLFRRDMKQLVRDMSEVLERFDVPDEALRAMMELTERT